MIYPVVAYGMSVLKKKCAEISKSDKSLDLKKLSEDMFETMYAADGVGLAAPQINIPIQMFVVDGNPMVEEGEEKDFKHVFINPVMLEEYGKRWKYEEGCLSIPNIREEVERFDTIRISYYDVDWNEQELVLQGIKARIVQHEYDHLQGVLFTDYLSGFKKRLLKGRLAKISKGIAYADYKMIFPVLKKKLKRR
jgi:peptide deformylase